MRPRQIPPSKRIARVTVVSRALIGLLLHAMLSVAWGAVYTAGPADYDRVLRQLSAGDTLFLMPGFYHRGLRIHDLHGLPGKPITISGATGNAATVLLGTPGRNTVSIRNAAHITLRDIEIDGRSAFVDGVKAEGNADYAHHITLENLYIHDLAQEQQSVGISSKCPAWDWVVRGNRIERVGTGMYFGDSDGSAPFIGGLIEDNQVIDTIGYNLQLKHQARREQQAGMPTGRRFTIIRGNRFVKAENASSGKAARPNVLIGHLPLEGPGRDDTYLIYRNLFFQNPGEALFQGEGNLALYANLFFNSLASGFPAVAIQPHNDEPRDVKIISNTIVHRSAGIRVRRRDESRLPAPIVAANAIFSEQPLQGGAPEGNFLAEYATVEEFLENPVEDLTRLRLKPLPGRLQGDLPDLDRFADLPDLDRDFDGLDRPWIRYGAYGLGR